MTLIIPAGCNTCSDPCAIPPTLGIVSICFDSNPDPVPGDVIYKCVDFLGVQTGNSCPILPPGYVTISASPCPGDISPNRQGSAYIDVASAYNDGGWTSSVEIDLYVAWHWSPEGDVDVNVHYLGVIQTKTVTPGANPFLVCECTFTKMATITVYDDGTFILT